MEVSEISATDGVLPGAGEPSAAQYHLSSSWRLEKTNDQWLLYGGDDAKFEIEPADFLEDLACGRYISRQSLSGEDRPLFEKLASAKALYYDPIENGVVVLPPEAPEWQEAASRINLGADSHPAMIIGAMFTDRVTAKYGERGARFALLEAGALLQQLSLSVADQKMSGVAIGGLMDAYWCDKLQLAQYQAKLAFGHLMGR